MFDVARLVIASPTRAAFVSRTNDSEHTITGFRVNQMKIINILRNGFHRLKKLVFVFESKRKKKQKKKH